MAWLTPRITSRSTLYLILPKKKGDPELKKELKKELNKSQWLDRWWPAALKACKTFGRPLCLNRRVGQSLRSSSAHNVGDQHDQHKRDQGASDWRWREEEID